MAAVHLKSTAVTNASATPRVFNSANVQNGNLRAAQGMATITSGNSSGATYRLFRVRSSDRMDSLRIYSPDIGTTTVGHIGLYDVSDVNAGAVVDVDFFAASLSLKDGALNGVDITFQAAAAGGLITNSEKRIWESISGLTSDPGKEYDVVLTLSADADASGVVLVRAQYVTGE